MNKIKKLFLIQKELRYWNKKFKESEYTWDIGGRYVNKANIYRLKRERLYLFEELISFIMAVVIYILIMVGIILIGKGLYELGLFL